MWENKRIDEKRKLKVTAVPTIFGTEAKEIVSIINTNFWKSIKSLYKIFTLVMVNPKYLISEKLL